MRLSYREKNPSEGSEPVAHPSYQSKATAEARVSAGDLPSRISASAPTAPPPPLPEPAARVGRREPFPVAPPASSPCRLDLSPAADIADRVPLPHPFPAR